MARIGQARASLAATLAESIVIAASAPRPYRRVFGRVHHRFSRLSMIMILTTVGSGPPRHLSPQRQVCKGLCTNEL